MKKIIIMIGLLNCLGAAHVAAQVKQQTHSWSNLPQASQPVFPKDTISILRFGARNDGITMNTKSINDAIAFCSQKGGGVVLVPGGLWLTGPVQMKSNVNLHIVREALLFFTPAFEEYRLVEGVYEGRRSARNQSPISGNNLVNIAITGKGVIDGNGDVWRMVGKDRLTESAWKKKVASGGLVSNDGKLWYPSTKTKLAYETKRTSTMEPGQTLKDFEPIKDYLRPNLVVFSNCKRVLLEGITFQNSPAWCLHPLLCEDLTIHDVFVKNPDYAQNGDGLDLESCRNVVVDGCTFDVGDDGICIKSGKDEEGRKRNVPTENVLIRNSIVYKGHGGFVIGSEMSGGARNIFIEDCSFIGTDKGLRFKTVRGRGGVVEDIYVRNIYMKDIVDEAIYFDMYYFTQPPAPGEKTPVPAVTEATPQFRNFDIRNVTCAGAGKGIFVRGLPEMQVENVRIENTVLQTEQGAEIIEAENIVLKNLTLLSAKTSPVIYMENSSAIVIDKLTYSDNTDVLLKINGAKSKTIKVINTNTGNSKKPLETVEGATSNAVSLN